MVNPAWFHQVSTPERSTRGSLGGVGTNGAASEEEVVDG